MPTTFGGGGQRCKVTAITAYDYSLPPSKKKENSNLGNFLNSQEGRVHMDVGLELRKERKARGFTQEELAYILGWSPSKISKIENGEQEITLNETIELMKAMKAKKIGTFIINDYQQPSLISS